MTLELASGLLLFPFTWRAGFSMESSQQNTTFWHLCYQSKPRGQLANLQLITKNSSPAGPTLKHPDTKTSSAEFQPVFWAMRLQEGCAMGESDSRETRNRRSSINFIKAANISAFSWLHSTHEVQRLGVASRKSTVITFLFSTCPPILWLKKNPELHRIQLDPKQPF